MSMRVKCFFSAMALTGAIATFDAASGLTSRSVLAQEKMNTIPEQVDRLFYGTDGAYAERRVTRSSELILGLPGFPENLISQDAERLHQTYRNLLHQQVARDPLMVSTDLPNPYNFSVLTLPAAAMPRSEMPAAAMPRSEMRWQSESPTVSAPVERLPQRF
jgi:hypothetical protein